MVSGSFSECPQRLPWACQKLDRSLILSGLARIFQVFALGYGLGLHPRNPFSRKETWTLATQGPGYTVRELRPALSDTAPLAR